MWDKEKEPFERAASQLFSGIAPGEIVVGWVAGISREGHPLVDYPENPTGEPLVAISTLSINQQHDGRQVALLFAQGDPARPVIMGLIHSPLNALIENFELSIQSADLHHEEMQNDAPLDDVKIDGTRVVLEGKEEIVLKCGDASITLTKAGKIIIRGKYILNRSSGVNRIMGGSVQVN